MDAFLYSIGYWNLFGCFVMLGFFNETFGRNLLNGWTKIFNEPFTLNYWSKFWLTWAIGLNIFYALANIFAACWSFPQLKLFLILSDLAAYLLFLLLAVWGWRSGRCGPGIYSVFAIFFIWICWAAYALTQA